MTDQKVTDFDSELEPQPLELYAQKVRETFQIEELKEIVFDELKQLPTEIERRRALLRYFIPDIFQPGRYDRRADLIDACIYYLEGKNRKTVLNLWAQRAQFNWKALIAKDIEQGPYGYEEYHPIYFTLGNSVNFTLSSTLPKLIQHLRCFKDRKLKLDINDYSTIYFSLFEADAQAMTPLTLKFLQDVEEALTAPTWVGLNLKKFMVEKGFKENTHLIALLKRSGLKLLTLLERSVFGLGHLVLQFHFPYHYKVNYKKRALAQSFLTGGGEYLQEVTISFPTEGDWRTLVRPLHPETEIFRQTFLRQPYTPRLHLYDASLQAWTIPWEKVIQEWRECLEANADKTVAIDLEYDAFIPKPEELRIAALIEEDSFYTDRDLCERTQLPLGEVQTIRKFIEEEVVAQRTLYVSFRDISDYCYVDIPSTDIGKFNLLSKIGETFPAFILIHLENLKTGEKMLRGIYSHTPQNIQRFLKTFDDIFEGAFEYKIHTSLKKMRLQLPFHEYYKFDPAIGRWKSEDQFRFQPVWR